MTSSLAFFCSDIREEKSNSTTLVGVLPDNLDIVAFPSALAKLAVYVRTPMFADGFVEPAEIFLIAPSGEEVQIGKIDDETIERIKPKFVESESPVTFIVSSAVFAPFLVKEPGRFRVVLRRNGLEYLCGALNFKLKAAESSSTSPTASPPPS